MNRDKLKSGSCSAGKIHRLHIFVYFLGVTGFRNEEFDVFFFELNYSNSSQGWGRRVSRGPKIFKSIYLGPINTCAKFDQI